MQARVAACRKALSRASFVAFDCEFSGLTAPGQPPVQTMDDAQAMYSKMRGSVKQLSMLQFGFSCFRFDAARKCFVVEPFAFYLLQTPIKGCGERYFLSQNSSIKFLIDNNFDFTRCFREGVNFLSMAEEESVRSRLQRFGELENVVTREDNLKEISDVQKLVSEWLDSSKEEEKTKLFPSSNGFMKAMLAQELPKLIPNINAFTTREPGVTVTKLTPEEGVEAAAAREAKRQKQHDFMEEAIGFRRVIEAITESGIPVMGHNMMIDCLQVVDKFVRPLPDTMVEFKSALRQVFPSIVDTKLLCEIAPEVNSLFPNGTYLEGALNAMKKDSDIKFEFESDGVPIEIQEQCHDASFDAYMTGALYIHIAAKIAQAHNVPYEGTLLPHHQMMAKYINRVHVVRSLLCSIDLATDGDSYDFSHAVLVSEFGLETKTHHLLELFKDIGGCQVLWIDDTSAVCYLTNPSRKDEALAKSNDKIKVSVIEDIADIKSKFAAASAEQEEKAGNGNSNNNKRRQTMVLEELHPPNSACKPPAAPMMVDADSSSSSSAAAGAGGGGGAAAEEEGEKKPRQHKKKARKSAE